jgi:hypothetical protein
VTDFTNLATLVAQGQSLLDLIQGGHITQLEADNLAKLNEIDVDYAAKKAVWGAAITNSIDYVPNIILTKNQDLFITSGSVPDFSALNSYATTELVQAVTKLAPRTQPEIDLLNAIQTDLNTVFPEFDIRAGNDYVFGFNVIRLSWDFTAVPDASKWLFHMHGKSEHGIETLLHNNWGKGNADGKWVYGNTVFPVAGGFGSYRNAVGIASSTIGSLLICLPVVVTGDISADPDSIINAISLG